MAQSCPQRFRHTNGLVHANATGNIPRRLQKSALASSFYKSCLFACLLCLFILTGSDSKFSCPLGGPISCICVPHILPSPTYGAKLPTKAWAYEWLGACKCCWQHTTASSAECVSKFVLQVLLACLLACLLCLFILTGSDSKFSCPLG